MNSYILLFLISIFYQSGFSAVEEKSEENKMAEKVKELGEKLKSAELIESDNFAEKLLEFRKLALSYITEFDVHCRRGVKKEANDEGQKRIKMTKAERQVCFGKLKQVYGEVIQKVYYAQKKNLQKSHELELEQLGNLRKESLIDLEKAYHRYLK